MDRVQIFINTINGPIAVSNPEDIRIAYGDYWIEFKDGEVQVMKKSSANEQ